MAKARSPQYPAVGLKEAVDKIGEIYGKDYQNKISRAVIAKHMGYDSLHGKALSILSALGKYGLLEGRADESRVSDLAVTIIAHPPGSPERVAALKEAAENPELFADINKRFNGGKGSDPAIRSYLLTQKFIPGAADLAIRSYRETKQLVETESGGYAGDQPEPEKPMTPQGQPVRRDTREIIPAAPSLLNAGAKVGTRQEVITLDEGDVVISFPENLSAQSFGDLKAHLDLFVKKMQRRAYVPPGQATQTILGGARSDDDEAAN